MTGFLASRPFAVTCAVVPALALCLGAGASLVRGDDAESNPDDHSELHLRYAEARLKLAKLDLARATLINDRADGEVAEMDLRRLRARVTVLESIVEATRLHPHGNGLEGHKARARAAVAIAAEDLDSLDEFPAQDDPMGRILLDRYRARLEIAKLRLALLEDPTNVPSPFDQMQLQLDQITDHVLDLLDQIENQSTIIPPP